MSEIDSNDLSVNEEYDTPMDFKSLSANLMKLLKPKSDEPKVDLRSNRFENLATEQSDSNIGEVADLVYQGEYDSDLLMYGALNGEDREFMNYYNKLHGSASLTASTFKEMKDERSVARRYLITAMREEVTKMLFNMDDALEESKRGLNLLRQLKTAFSKQKEYIDEMLNDADEEDSPFDAILEAVKNGDYLTAQKIISKLSPAALNEYLEPIASNFKKEELLTEVSDKDLGAKFSDGFALLKDLVNTHVTGELSVTGFALTGMGVTKGEFKESLAAINDLGDKYGAGTLTGTKITDVTNAVSVLKTYFIMIVVLNDRFNVYESQHARRMEKSRKDFAFSSAGKRATQLIAVFDDMLTGIPTVDSTRMPEAAPQPAVISLLQLFGSGRNTQLSALKLEEVNALFNIYYGTYDPAKLDIDIITEEDLIALDNSGSKSITADTPLYHEFITVNNLIGLNINLYVWQALSGRKLSGFTSRVFETIHVRKGAIGNISTFKAILAENVRINTGVDII